MQTSVQKQLSRSIPEFNNKNKLVQYYVGYQFPERQKKLIIWWRQCIEFAIEKSKEVYLSPAELQMIFSVHGLKPLPLPNILKQLAETADFKWQNKTIPPTKTFMTQILGYIWNNQKHNISLASDIQSKFVSVQYIARLKIKTKQIIESSSVDSKLIEYNKIQDSIKYNLEISYKAIKFLLTQLERQQFFMISSINKQKFIFYSSSSEQNNTSTLQVEKSKYLLTKKCEELKRKIQIYQNQQLKLRQLAKNCLIENNQRKATEYIKQSKKKTQFADTIRNRQKLLQNKLHQLQTHQLNGITIGLVSEAQQWIQKIALDPSSISELIQKGRQTKANQEQFDNKMKDWQEGEQEDLDDDVNNLLKQLESQVTNQKTKKIQPIYQKVSIPSRASSQKVEKQQERKFLRLLDLA